MSSHITDDSTPTTSDELLRPQLPRFCWYIIPQFVSYLFGWYGIFVGRYPYVILVLALSTAFVSSAGLYRLSQVYTNADPVHLFIPAESQSVTDRSASLLFSTRDMMHSEPDDHIDIYPLNKTDLVLKCDTSGHRLKRQEPSGARKRAKRQAYSNQDCHRWNAILVAKGNYDFWSVPMIEEVKKFEKKVFAVKVEGNKLQKGMWFAYEDLCTSENGAKVVSVSDCRGYFTQNLEKSTGHGAVDMIIGDDALIKVTFPTFDGADLSQFLGGVTTTGGLDSAIISVKAWNMVLCFNLYSSLWSRLGSKYEQALGKFMNEYRSDYFSIHWTYQDQHMEVMDGVAFTLLPQIGLTFAAVLVWCMIGAISQDAVRSKPYIGLIGVICTLLACTSGFGVMFWIGLPVYTFVLAAPLLTLAIGLDDMFILLSAWGRTNPRLHVEERMMLTMEEGGTSILITFFINVIGFFVGTYAPYEAVNLLSSYSIATMTFDFVLQMTILTSCLSLSARADSSQSHSLCCCFSLPLRGTAIQSDRAVCSVVCCAGGVKSSDEVLIEDEDNDEQVPITRFMTNWYAPVLFSWPVRIIVVLGYLAFIAISLNFAMNIKIGMNPERLAPENGNLWSYIVTHRRYFTQYGKKVQVTFLNPVDYADPVKQQNALSLFTNIETSVYFWDWEETTFWLREFNTWRGNYALNCSRLPGCADKYEDGKCYRDGCAACNSQRSMIAMMRAQDGFIADDASRSGTLAKDIRIELDGERFRTTRGWVRTKDMSTPQRGINMMETIRRLTAQMINSDMHVIAFEDDFRPYDQYLTILPMSLYYIAVTFICTLVASFLMLPHPVCVFWVAIGLLSTVIGIFGLMATWGIDLDSIALMTLLVAIGFAADFIVHGTYLYMISQPPPGIFTSKGVRLHKATAMVANVGTAALPAAIGTIMSLLPFATSDSYIFYAFFRVMTLSVVLSLLQALVFLPVFLSFFGPISSSSSRSPVDSDTADSCHSETSSHEPKVEVVKEEVIQLDRRDDPRNTDWGDLIARYSPPESVSTQFSSVTHINSRRWPEFPTSSNLPRREVERRHSASYHREEISRRDIDNGLDDIKRGKYETLALPRTSRVVTTNSSAQTSDLGSVGGGIRRVESARYTNLPTTLPRHNSRRTMPLDTSVEESDPRYSYGIHETRRRADRSRRAEPSQSRPEKAVQPVRQRSPVQHLSPPQHAHRGRSLFSVGVTPRMVNRFRNKAAPNVQKSQHVDRFHF